MGARGLIGLGLAATVLIAALAGPAAAQEARGSWTFRDDERPVKAVVLGGSIAAFHGGSFGRFIEAACPRVEVRNIAQARLGAAALRDRFVSQVVRNRRLDPAAFESIWLVFYGGLNSIGSPESTNRHTASLLSRASEHGLGTVALTISPWGSERDARWGPERGLEYLDHTRKAVDFLLGRLTPEEALGRFAGGQEAWTSGELPDIAVDLWDSPLRHADAEPRARARIARAVARSAWVRARTRGLEGEEREAAIEAYVDQAAELPRWFMRPEYRGFDAIHPNDEGHRMIAVTMCPRMPASWGCECDRLAGARWDRRAREVVLGEGPGEGQGPAELRTGVSE